MLFVEKPLAEKSPSLRLYPKVVWLLPSRSITIESVWTVFDIVRRWLAIAFF
jgi:hypothetical protein